MEFKAPEKNQKVTVDEDVVKEEKGEMIINPNQFVNDSDKEINYDKIIEQFGCSKLSKDLLERFEKLTGVKVHPLLEREIFFAHRDFKVMLDHYESGKPIFLYTGRGPSTESMHLGHLLPFIVTKWLQDVFKCPLVIQLSDDEKFFYQKTEKAEDIDFFIKIADENAKDIIACGFDPERTFIFKNTSYMPHFYPNVCRIQRAITYNQIKGIFGLDGSENSGKIAYPAIQAAPCMGSSFPHILGHKNDALCIIPMGIDQDPYFRMTRDIAAKLKFPKPVCIYSKFFPALQGFKSKMSSSDENSAIFLHDTPNKIKNKINKYAFSGGQATIEEHREKGANIEVDIAYNYLKYFMDDTEKLSEIGAKYSKGELLTSEVKKEAIAVLQKIVGDHQARKSKLTEEVVKTFMKIRPLLMK